MSATARQRRYRQKQRRGEAVYRVTADHRLLHALVEAGRLSDGDTADRGKVEGEIGAVLAEWARIWAEK